MKKSLSFMHVPKDIVDKCSWYCVKRKDIIIILQAVMISIQIKQLVETFTLLFDPLRFLIPLYSRDSDKVVYLTSLCVYLLSGFCIETTSFMKFWVDLKVKHYPKIVFKTLTEAV